MATLARRLNASLDLTSKMAVISGGSQGIGAGIALRFAKAGSSVVILGRNKNLLNQVVDECKKVAKGGASGKTFDFIEADLSTTSGMKQAANAIEKKASGGVDYLIQTQGVLREASVTVCAPGGNQTAFDLDDIECKSLKDRNALTLLAAMGKRDGVIIDAYQKGLSAQFPNIAYYHLFPGIVTTNGASNSGFPFPLPQLFSLASPIISRTVGNSPESYAEIPVLVAANPSPEKKELVAREGTNLNMWLKKVSPAPWSAQPENQKRVVEKLKSYGI